MASISTLLIKIHYDSLWELSLQISFFFTSKGSLVFVRNENMALLYFDQRASQLSEIKFGVRM